MTTPSRGGMPSDADHGLCGGPPARAEPLDRRGERFPVRRFERRARWTYLHHTLNRRSRKFCVVTSRHRVPSSAIFTAESNRSAGSCPGCDPQDVLGVR